MPEFIDFLLIFGKQTRAQDFHFSAFKKRTRLDPSTSQGPSHRLKIPELGWSGSDLQICYNMKSMEHSSQGDWPWSPRDCAINHTFDLVNIRTTWIMIKGNTLIQDRVRSAITFQSPAELSSFQTLGSAFASTLATHLIVSDWAAENWHHFISFIEARYHEIARRAMSDEIDVPPTIVREAGGAPFQKLKHTDTVKSANSLSSTITNGRTGTFDSLLSMRKEKALVSPPSANVEVGSKPHPSPATKGTLKVEFETRGQKEFSFGDSQALRHLHERAKEAVLILQLNMKIMSHLLQYYKTTLSSKRFPEAILQTCLDDFEIFQSRVESIGDDLHTQVLKLETLIENMTGCETLVRDSTVCIEKQLTVGSFTAF